MSSCQSCGDALPDGTSVCQSCGSPAELRAGVSMSAVECSASGAIPPQCEKGGSKAMDTNVAGALSYLAGFITGILFLVLAPYRSNSFIRFHAIQSIFFNAAWVASWILWMTLSAVLSPLTGGFGLIALPVMLIFTLTGLGIWIALMYQAYQQKLFKLPIVGKLAADHAGVRL